MQESHKVANLTAVFEITIAGHFNGTISTYAALHYVLPTISTYQCTCSFKWSWNKEITLPEAFLVPSLWVRVGAKLRFTFW